MLAYADSYSEHLMQLVPDIVYRYIHIQLYLYSCLFRVVLIVRTTSRGMLTQTNCKAEKGMNCDLVPCSVQMT